MENAWTLFHRGAAWQRYTCYGGSYTIQHGTDSENRRKCTLILRLGCYTARVLDNEGQTISPMQLPVQPGDRVSCGSTTDTAYAWRITSVEKEDGIGVAQGLVLVAE